MKSCVSRSFLNPVSCTPRPGAYLYHRLILSLRWRLQPCSSIRHLPEELLRCPVRSHVHHPSREEADLKFLPVRLVESLTVHEIKRFESRQFTLLPFLLLVVTTPLSSPCPRLPLSLFSLSSPFPPHLISSHLISSHLISSHLFSSLLFSSHLFSSHLFSSHLFSSHLFSSLLISSHLISPLFSCFTRKEKFLFFQNLLFRVDAFLCTPAFPF